LFTGIIEEVGTVGELGDNKLTIRAAKVMEGQKMGDSIAVNGTCLTVVAYDSTTFSVDLSPETLSRTSLGSLEQNHKVNLERPLAVSDRLGGHIVQGHVDATGRITSSRTEGNSQVLRVRYPERMRPYIVEKGFIAVDGISLTVVQKGTSTFTLSVIPFTLENTNLQDKGVGDRVNLEIDIIAKYVESLMAR
jgi:riboflavin synthase